MLNLKKQKEMETNDLSKDFMRKSVENDAWKKLSEEFAWSEELIDKYKGKIDWSAISENSNMRWTTSMLEKYKSLIDWKRLSDLSQEYLFSLHYLEQFKNYWDWSTLSGNSFIKFSYELIDAFIDKWDWKEFFDTWMRGLDDLYSEDFLSKYSQYIPVDGLQSSRLWDKIVEQKKDELEKNLLSSN